MTDPVDPLELFEFPCNHEFKAFGDADTAFAEAVRAAASQVLPVSRDAMRVRGSSGGKYQCVSVLLQLQSADQLRAVYEALRQVQGIRYLL